PDRAAPAGTRACRAAGGGARPRRAARAARVARARGVRRGDARRDPPAHRVPAPDPRDLRLAREPAGRRSRPPPGRRPDRGGAPPGSREGDALRGDRRARRRRARLRAPARRAAGRRVNLLVVVASATGRTRRMADALADGAREAGAKVLLRTPDETQDADLLE